MSNYRCPRCGTTNISIQANIWITPTEHGHEENSGDKSWEPESHAICQSADFCGHAGTVKDFEGDNFEADAPPLLESL